jgi:hypothetical protein
MKLTPGKCCSRIFKEKFPDFWMRIRFSQENFSIDEFANIGCIILKYIANFNVIDLKRLDNYLEDLIDRFKNVNEEYYNEILHFYWHINDEILYIQNKNKEINKELFPKISKRFKYESKYTDPDLHVKTINNPWTYRIVCQDQNYDDDTDWDEEDIYYLLSEYQREKRSYHYYLMLYVYDLTMRMQKIKSELIKYELARYKKEQSKPLDFMINELIIEYIKLNKEFIIYNSLLSKEDYWCEDSLLLYPNSINIITDYENKFFHWKIYEFNTVMKEKQGQANNNSIFVTEDNFTYKRQVGLLENYDIHKCTIKKIE